MTDYSERRGRRGGEGRGEERRGEERRGEGERRRGGEGRGEEGRGGEGKEERREERGEERGERREERGERREERGANRTPTLPNYYYFKSVIMRYVVCAPSEYTVDRVLTCVEGAHRYFWICTQQSSQECTKEISYRG